MQAFATLFKNLDSTTSTNAKVSALVQYFQIVSPEDALWTIALFTHKRPKRTIKTSLLREWAAQSANIPQWLFEDTYHVVGDLAETIALTVPQATKQSDQSLTTWIEQIKALHKEADKVKQDFILNAWDQLDFASRFLFNKLITGGFRLGVSKKLITKALSKFLEKEETEIAHRLMGDWSPDNTSFEELLIAEGFDKSLSKPYPFFLAYALESSPDELGKPKDWLAEYKWDGIRGQIIKRKGEIFVWSRGEELINDAFPEFQSLADCAADNFVVDGEIIVFNNGKLGSFKDLQSRLGRKKVSKNLLAKLPAQLIVYDLLEWDGKDIRAETQSKRRQRLEESQLANHALITLSESIIFNDWKTLAKIRSEARSHDAEGLMLKAMHTPYQIGRKKGGWWKWKLDPYTIDAVLLYAQRGHGRRSNLYSDYTFAVWNTEGKLVPFAKAYSGLTDAEFREVTKFVNANTLERFGPVRSVKPELVFEVAFEGISYSKRHKSGIALRFPRIHRWRKDKKASEANTLEDLEGLLINKT